MALQHYLHAKSNVINDSLPLYMKGDIPARKQCVSV